MAAPIRPAADSTRQKHNLIFVPAIAAIGAPSVTELTATSVLDASLIIYSDNTDLPSGDTASVSEPGRFGDGATYEDAGDDSFTGGVLTYAFANQADEGDDGRKMYEQLPSGYQGFLVQRIGVDIDTAVTADQRVNVWPIKVGVSTPTTVGDGASAKAAMRARYFITGQPAISVVVSA